MIGFCRPSVPPPALLLLLSFFFFFFFLNMLSFFVTSRLAYKPLPFFSWCPMKKFPELESSSKTLRSGSSREKDSYTSSSSSLSPLLKTNFLENNSVTVARFFCRSSVVVVKTRHQHFHHHHPHHHLPRVYL